MMEDRLAKMDYFDPSGLKEYISAGYANETYPCSRTSIWRMSLGKKRIRYSSLLLVTSLFFATSVTIYMITTQMRRKRCRSSGGSSIINRN
jgi:hypothetical protein